ncbi:MAG: hypothetical protein RL596_450 [Bacteroidota bacterium]
MGMKRGLCFLLGFYCICSIYAQFPYTQKFAHPVQPPTQVIYDMLNDKEGYIWLATDKGLYRFNGHSFKEIVFSETNLRSISYLQQDPQGVIWCMNFYKELYYVQNDSLKKFALKDKGIDRSSVFLNVAVTENDIWIGATKKIYQISKKTGLVSRTIISNESIGITYINTLNNKMIAYSGKGYLLQFPAKERSWKPIPFVLGASRMLCTGKQITVASLGKKRAPGFIIEDSGIRKIPAINLPEEAYIYHFASTGGSKQWICAQTGAYLWDTETGKTTCVLPNERVSDVVKDFQGNYWISTLDNGLFVCPSLSNILYKVHPGNSMDNIMRVELLSNTKVVTGSSKGLLATFDVGKNTVFHYNLPISSEVEFIKYDTKNKLIFNNRGILKELQKNVVEEYNYSKAIVRDKDNNIIVASFGSAYIINNNFGKYTQRLPVINNSLYAQFKKIYVGNKTDSVLLIRDIRSNAALMAADSTRFWVAYEDGLYEYNYNGHIYAITKPNGAPIIARSLIEKANGQLVAGTTTDGIYFIQQRKSVKHFSVTEGLKSNNIKRCFLYGEDVWVLTDESIDIIDSKTKTVAGLLDELGLEELQVNDFAVNRERFFIATTNGLLVNRQPQAIQHQIIRFPKFEAIANGATFLSNSFLPYNKNNISFQLEALHFKSATSLFYRYKLVGLDTAWRTAAYFITSIPYNRLAPGKYIFQIQASDAGGKYKSEMLRFDFTISPPFWKRWWIIIIIFLSIAGLVYFSMRWWTNRLLARETLQEKLLKSQLVALRSQMNPHFLYNVLNTVQGLVYDNKKIEASNLLGNFSDLMRKTLESSEKQLQTLKDETENLRLYLELEKARFDGDFSYQIQIDLIDDLSILLIPSLLLQPLAENAVKHGLMHKQGAKLLTISFNAVQEGMLIQIDDNGIGRKQSMIINERNKNKPKSFATKALDERVTLFNKLYAIPIRYSIIDKLDNNDQSLGTCVELLIPYYHLT